MSIINVSARVAAMGVVCALVSLMIAGCSAHKAGHVQQPPAAGRSTGSKSPCPPPIAGTEVLTGSVVLLGETHGTTEIPAAFASLVCEIATRKPKGTVLVGLEFPAESQKAIDAWLASDGTVAAEVALLTESFWLRDYQDGRSSEATLRLLNDLRRFRAAKLDIAVRALDVTVSKSAAERDARMAATLNEGIAATQPKQTLVLVGDVHSRILGGYPWNPNDPYFPLGALLKGTHDDVLGLNVTSGGGSAWTCSSGSAADCGAREWKHREISGDVPRFELRPEAIAKTGWSGTLFLSSISASPPARDGK